MQHDEWTAAIRKLMRSSDTSTEDWDAQLADTEAAEKTSVGDWHTQQTLGLYADFLRTKNQIEAAGQIDERIGNDAESHIIFWHVTAGTALAQSALDHFTIGNSEKAIALANRAIAHFGHSADPSPVYEKLIAELRSHS
jgi:hypothetical protein